MFEKMDRASTGIMAKMEIGSSSYHHGPSSSTPSGSGTTSQGYTVVPMKLYANWEVGTSSNNVQRVLTMIVNRLILPISLRNDTTFSVAVRLQGHKRTLRSNDINLPTQGTGYSAATSGGDISLDISFTIQYSHFLKRKSNILQILIQRRRRYKNRHILGFKTLAIGHVNLDDVLQYAGSREIRIWDANMLNKTDMELNEYGTVFISHCQSQALDIEGSHKHSPKEGGLASEDDDDDDTEESDFEVQDEDGTPRYGQSNPKRTTRKKLNQKNIKSKLTALLKRFKAQDAGPSSIGRLPPTEEELEEIFEELENISDSGPELEPDKMSIISNPKPGLRPFFGSKSDILPPIEDRIPSDDSPVDSDDFSSDNENHPMFLSNVQYPLDPSRTPTTTTAHGKHSVPDTRASRSSSIKEKNRITHSATTGSIGSAHDLKQLAIGPSGKKTTADMIAHIEDPGTAMASNIWLASSSDIPWLTKVNVTDFKAIKLIDCGSNVQEIRSVIQAVVGKIQKFCNSNSTEPPMTMIGLLGSDRLVSNVVRVYVDLLQNKNTQEWLNYLRFNLLIPPNSIIGRSLATITDGGLLEIQWKTFNRLNPSETRAIEECLQASGGSVKALNIPIGEVMLQLYENGSHHHQHVGEKPSDEADSQVFIPFVAEIHLGNLDELNCLHYLKSGAEDEAKHMSSNVAGQGIGSMSPPTSPQTSKTNDSKELQIEYWTTVSANHDVHSSGFHSSGNSERLSGTTMTTPKLSSSGGKFSMKASVRTLSIAREPLSTLLSMLFVKERKKDKVLQKLGRKTKPRSADIVNSQSRVVSSVTRMICSGKSSPLEIAIDGVTWNRIRFFQITSQWQTHVKFFPISVPSSPATSNMR